MGYFSVYISPLLFFLITVYFVFEILLSVENIIKLLTIGPVNDLKSYDYLISYPMETMKG
ncbi:MAG TPA: hypothetical protein VN704_00670 [Verrucomicrobiae bacterium]|nr:hypothetical protein [Verrucomicrobiae bacterium]